MTDAAGVPPQARQVPSARLITTLGGAGAIVGLCIALIYRWTLPTIQANKAAALRGAIAEVLHAPERCDTIWLVNGALTTEPPRADMARTAERVYLGYDSAGKATGVAIVTSSPGFADDIALIFGYEPRSHRLLGMKILTTKETPGIADKIEKPVFTTQFKDAVTPLKGVKGARGSDPSQIAMITGATISSRAVLKGINKAVARWQPLLDAHRTPAAAGQGGRP